MMDIRGATSDAAHNALAPSAASRRPRFLVFHVCFSCDVTSAECFDGTITRGGCSLSSSWMWDTNASLRLLSLEIFSLMLHGGAGRVQV
jgi:hypothetical protein